MHKKNTSNNSSGGLVYSTNPDFALPKDDLEEEVTSPVSLQKIKIRLDTRNRAGKAVTLVSGFTGKNKDRETLGKNLKGFCGTGGSVKDGDILIQGDNRDRILQWLIKNGYTLAKIN